MKRTTEIVRERMFRLSVVDLKAFKNDPIKKKKKKHDQCICNPQELRNPEQLRIEREGENIATRTNFETLTTCWKFFFVIKKKKIASAPTKSQTFELSLCDKRPCRMIFAFERDEFKEILALHYSPRGH